jgi:hypothetical protein
MLLRKLEFNKENKVKSNELSYFFENQRDNGNLNQKQLIHTIKNISNN